MHQPKTRPPSHGFIDSFAPAIMGMVVAFICTVLTLLSVVREKVDGTFARVWVSPVRRAEFILGYIVAFGLIALVQSVLVLSIGKGVFGIVINGSLGWAFAGVILFAIGSVGLGTLLSALAETESQAILFFPLVLLPSVLLSGMMWPLQAIPALLRPLSYIVPLTYSNRPLAGGDGEGACALAGAAWLHRRPRLRGPDDRPRERCPAPVGRGEGLARADLPRPLGSFFQRPAALSRREKGVILPSGLPLDRLLTIPPGVRPSCSRCTSIVPANGMATGLRQQ